MWPHMRESVLSSLITLVAASPLQPRQAITSLSQAQINAYTPYTHYASTGHCAANTTLKWSCGANCDANPNFFPIASGGDGTSVQFWFVGYDPILKTIIVSHQGTNPKKIKPILTDLHAGFWRLDSALFPGISSSIKVHRGFAVAQASAAREVLFAVRKGLARHKATKVTVVGHSLGAAIAVLDSVYLKHHLKSSVSVVTIGYGLPRVGNQAFADYVDSYLSLTYITNRKDPIPIMPGKLLGYVHPAGEVHIQDSGAWDACPGQDNGSQLCIVGNVRNLMAGDESNHDGPYNGITLFC